MKQSRHGCIKCKFSQQPKQFIHPGWLIAPFLPKQGGRAPPSPPPLPLGDTISWTSFFPSNTPRCSPYCSLHAWSNTHKESVSYIHLLLTFFALSLSFSLIFFACVIFPYISGSRQGHSIWNSTGRKKVVACVTARLDDEGGQILANIRLEALWSFCCSPILEATFEDAGVGVRCEEGLSCKRREEARLWPVDGPSAPLIKQSEHGGVKQRCWIAIVELSLSRLSRLSPVGFIRRPSFFLSWIQSYFRSRGVGSRIWDESKGVEMCEHVFSPSLMEPGDFCTSTPQVRLTPEVN